MKRFDVSVASGGGVAGGKRLVIVLQHELLDVLDMVVVAPLYLVRDLPPLSHLRPVVEIDSASYVVAIHRLAALPRPQLAQPPIVNIDHLANELTRAINLLFSGI